MQHYITYDVFKTATVTVSDILVSSDGIVLEFLQQVVDVVVIDLDV